MMQHHFVQIVRSLEQEDQGTASNVVFALKGLIIIAPGFTTV